MTVTMSVWSLASLILGVFGLAASYLRVSSRWEEGARVFNEERMVYLERKRKEALEELFQANRELAKARDELRALSPVTDGGYRASMARGEAGMGEDENRGGRGS